MFGLPGQSPLLRSEFSVGIHEPRDLRSVLDRARKRLAAVPEHSSDLAAHGWSAAATTAQSAATDALEAAGGDSSTASDAKPGATAQLYGGANVLYKLCRKVQSTANLVYPATKAFSDPTIVETRARFLLGEFPTRFRGAAKSPIAPVIPVAPATVPAAA